MRAPVARFAGVLLTIVAALTVACGGASDPKLAALQHEAVASFAPPDATLVSSTETKEHTTLGIPVHAELRRVFSYGDPATADRAQEILVDQARSDGWTMRVDTLNDVALGTKTLPTGPADLSIGDYEDGGVVKVVVRLVHR